MIVSSGEEEPEQESQELDDDSVSMEPGKGGPTPQQLNKMMHQALHTVNQLLIDLEKDKGETGWSSEPLRTFGVLPRQLQRLVVAGKPS